MRTTSALLSSTVTALWQPLAEISSPPETERQRSVCVFKGVGVRRLVFEEGNQGRTDALDDLRPHSQGLGASAPAWALVTLLSRANSSPMHAAALAMTAVQLGLVAASPSKRAEIAGTRTASKPPAPNRVVRHDDVIFLPFVEFFHQSVKCHEADREPDAEGGNPQAGFDSGETGHHARAERRCAAR